MSSAVGIALAFLLAPSQPVVSEPEPTLCDVAVRANGLDYDEFDAAVGLRLPGVRVREADGNADAECVDRVHAFVELRPIDVGMWELSLITSDGRAWFRTVASEPDQAPRVLASALANLVAAIEDASAEPDAHEVAVPAELGAEAEPVAPAEPTPEPDATPEPTPAARPGAIVLELGPRLTGGLVVGLAPGAGWRGAGGGFGLDLRLPDGLGFGLDVRAISTAAANVRLVRTRVALGLGWVARERRFEIPVLISGVIEPWLVRTAGSTTPLGQPPMIGGGARVAPGLLIALGSTQLRLGMSFGFEIAVEAARGGVTPAIARDPAAPPILRAGGVELSAGLELGVWIPVRELKTSTSSRARRR